MAIDITVGRRGLVRNQDPHCPEKAPDEGQSVPQSCVFQIQLPRVLSREVQWDSLKSFSVGCWGHSGSQLELVLQRTYSSAEEHWCAWSSPGRAGDKGDADAVRVQPTGLEMRSSSVTAPCGGVLQECAPSSLDTSVLHCQYCNTSLKPFGCYKHPPA